MFATTGYDQATVVRAVREAAGGVPLVGCSAEGVISERSRETPYALLVAVIKSDSVRFHPAKATGLKEDSRAAGRSLGEQLREKVSSDALGVMVFPDGLTVNFDELSAGFSEVTKPEKFLPLFGGTSADDWALKQTYQYLNDEVFSDGVSCALISGDATMAFALNHGCVRLGTERKVTKADGNVILEIDDKPALDVMKEYLDVDEVDDWQKATANLTVGFRAPDELRGLDEYVVRYVPGKDDDAGSVSIGTSVSAGESIWMMRRDYDKVSAGLNAVGDAIRDQLKGEEPALVFQFDCAGRGKVIFREDEMLQLQSQLRQRVSENAPWLGFHCYGEIGPVGTKSYFHNYTAVVAALV